MKVVVFGATGTIGGALVPVLARIGVPSALALGAIGGALAAVVSRRDD